MDEITRMALECLKIRLETSKLEEEVKKANAETTSIFLTQMDVWVTKLLDLLSDITAGPAGPARIKLRSMEINREDLTFFAKKATIPDLERLIADLSKILEERKPR